MNSIDLPLVLRISMSVLSLINNSLDHHQLGIMLLAQDSAVHILLTPDLSLEPCEAHHGYNQMKAWLAQLYSAPHNQLIVDIELHILALDLHHRSCRYSMSISCLYSLKILSSSFYQRSYDRSTRMVAKLSLLHDLYAKWIDLTLIMWMMEFFLLLIWKSDCKYPLMVHLYLQSQPRTQGSMATWSWVQGRN